MSTRNSRNLKKIKKGKNILFEAFMLISSSIIIIPLLMLLFGSFKDAAEAARFTISLPKKWHFENYIYVFTSGKLGRATFNSFIYAFFGVGLCTICAMLCAYIMERRPTRVTEVIYLYMNVGMVAPLMVIPTLAFLKALHIYGTYFSIILVFAGMYIPWSVFLFTSFMKNVPKELDEAAFMDGCKPVRLFFTIVMPLLKPIIATNIVFIAMNIWNEMMIPLYMVNSPEKTPVSLSVYQFYGSYFRDWNLVFADLVIASVPMVILYFYLQKYIISGLTVGAVKG